ncbi:MAG: PIG-L family deacetylase [Acidobacteria bacterium]|nr:PIG-L family deacetylase [Acidobacteriota bacterium]
MPSEPGGGSVFLLPHPDDEFAVSGMLRDTVLAGGDVQIVYLTDGGFSGQDVRVREQESLRVLARLGVPESRVQFLGREEGLHDGSLHEHLSRARAALERLMTVPPAAVYFPAWEGGHQDHDATHLLGLALARPPAVARQFPLYHGAGLPGPFFRVMAPLPGNGTSLRRPGSLRDRVEHLRLCLSYPSQWKTWVGLWPLVLLHALMDGGFHTQDVDVSRICGPPHPGRPLYERRGFLTWRAFDEATAAFREALVRERRPDR